MQIVIDIPDAPIKDYQDLFYKIHGMAAREGLFDDKVKSQSALALKVVLDILDGIVNGTPLPKGHGRLIEVTNQLEQELFTYTRYTGIDEYPYESATLDDAPTIIEADKHISGKEKE